MSDLFAGFCEASRAKLCKAPFPRRAKPMLATLTDTPFSEPGWIYERKLDGVRCLASRRSTRARLVSRNGRAMNATWPELLAALEALPGGAFVLDGEIVAFEGARTSFSRLQGRIGLRKAADARASGIPVFLYLFDVLHLEGYDTTKLPLRERKALLKRALPFESPIRYTPHRNERGEAYLEEACAKGWEGLLAKDATAPYVQSRSRRWLKLKCVNRQELVIGGYTEPRGSRRGFGALLVGTYEKGRLRYAGKVGTGYDHATLAALSKRLAGLERDDSPFDEPVKEAGAHFVRPTLVGEFAFTEWTEEGKLRHPRFLGLRPDKRPQQVHRERPA